MRYRYQINRSKTVEIKFVVVWANGTYIPIPVFIYDKTLACAFDYYNEAESGKIPFIPIAAKCSSMPEYRQLDFGPIAEGLNHTRTLTVANLNLMPIFIDKIRIEPPVCGDVKIDTSIELVADKAYDIMTRERKRDYSNENKTYYKLYDPEEIMKPQKGHSIVEASDFMIAPNTMVTFEVNVFSPIILYHHNCRKYEANIYFRSSQSPDFEIPISFLVIEAPTDFYSNLAEFPPIHLMEHRQVRELKIRSSIEYPMHILNAKSEDPSRVKIDIINRVLQPDEEVRVLKLSAMAFNNYNTYLRILQSQLFGK